MKQSKLVAILDRHDDGSPKTTLSLDDNDRPYFTEYAPQSSNALRRRILMAAIAILSLAIVVAILVLPNFA